MSVRPESEFPPSGCTFCGIGERRHGRQWHDPAGWHAWTAPTESQIRIRMLNRRAARQNQKEKALMSDTTTQPVDLGNEPIHGFFGLSYCSHLVLPRVLLQSMPAGWQRKFVALVEELETAFANVEKPSFYDVQAAVEKEASELTDAELAQTGVTYADTDNGLQFYNRNGDEIEWWTRVMVPVADPLPSYNRGRTQVPRADQLAEVDEEFRKLRGLEATREVVRSLRPEAGT